MKQDCEHDFEFCDDSFTHEFGTEIIRYWQCTICGYGYDDDGEHKQMYSHEEEAA